MWKQTGVQAIERVVYSISCFASKWSRSYSCSGKTTKSDTPKQTKAQSSENEERTRVRRAGAADVSQVLRFVRESCRNSVPGIQLTTTMNLVLNDYVARTLAQGHSMVAEQHLPRRGWAHMTGLALCQATCPWDSALLDKWARCIKCNQTKQLMNFSAHCMRIPVLHEKYNLLIILQTMLIVPPNVPNRMETVQMLVENAIKRGHDGGFQMLRFDVTNPEIAEMLEKLNLTKEWEANFVSESKQQANDLESRFDESDIISDPSCEGSTAEKKSIKVNLIENHREPPFVFTGIIDQPKSSGTQNTETTAKESAQVQEPIRTNIKYPHYIAVYSISVA